MKDIELVASLLLLIEDGITGYSQDDLDKAFSDRDAVWEAAVDAQQHFREVIEFVTELVNLPKDNPLARSRLRNQADFYSLFGAISTALKTHDDLLKLDKTELAQRLTTFLDDVDDENRRAENQSASRYLNAARSNSNDSGQRTLRVQAITSVLKAQHHDHVVSNSK